MSVEAFARGGEGALELARAVEATAKKPSSVRFLYELDASIEEKLRVLAREVYGARDIELSTSARESLDAWHHTDLARLPVCVAKTQYSLSHDPALLSVPRDYVFPIREVRASAGAGFVYALAGNVSTMPGLPKTPAAKRIDLDSNGNVVGMG